jgi:hypothetical protein
LTVEAIYCALIVTSAKDLTMPNRGKLLLLAIAITASASLPGCDALNRNGCYDSSRSIMLRPGGVPPIGSGWC